MRASFLISHATHWWAVFNVQVLNFNEFKMSFLSNSHSVQFVKCQMRPGAITYNRMSCLQKKLIFIKQVIPLRWRHLRTGNGKNLA